MTDQLGGAVPDPMLGARIGRYVIRRKLAEGGMGAVYIATHERLENVTKVIKTMLPAYAANAMLRDRFEREAHAVSRLRHRNIVQIDDFGQLPDGQLFLMMPFLEGQALDNLLQACGKLAEPHALQILVQVCNALQYMHETGLVHRDIKPSNIFLVREDDNPHHVYLIDLGIAKSLAERDAVTLTGATMGTPAYMAVEQYENASAVTPRADLYAVAIVAWEMITGVLPWGTHSTHVLYKKQLDERPMPPPGMSAALYEALLISLSPHPDSRPPSMAAFAGLLAHAVPDGIGILEKFAPALIRHSPQDAATPRAMPFPLLGAAASRKCPKDLVSPGPTTLTESSGVASAHPTPMPSRPRARLVAAAVAAVIITGVVYLSTRSMLRDSAALPAGRQAPERVDVVVPALVDASVPSTELADASVDASPPAVDAAMPVAGDKGGMRLPPHPPKSYLDKKFTKARPSTHPLDAGSRAPKQFNPNAPLGEQ